MDITRDPIFKSIMFALAVMYVALATNSAWAAKGGKPPSEPVPVIAEDVVCDGCVDTGDIADGAVTYQELSPVVVDDINLLDSRIATQESRTEIVAVDSNGNVIGRVVSVFGSGSGSGFKGQDVLTLLTNTEYDVTIRRKDGNIVNSGDSANTTYPDCYGIQAAKYTSPGMVTSNQNVGGVIAYTPRDSTGCHYADGTLAAFEILPNDPAITGVPTEGYAGPIRISIANQ
jgi:hypothetical protein